MDQKICRNCGKELKNYQSSYCSNKCQSELRYTDFITKWLSLNKQRKQLPFTKNISRHIKRFLLEKVGNRCGICRWGEKHPLTQRVPLEVDHIDGNSENSLLSNLRILCPNCHSLTPHFRNLNKGKGRKWRGNH